MSEFKLPKLEDEKSVLRTIRLKMNILNKLEEVSNQNNISINRLINECCEYALNNLKNDEKEK